MVPTSLVLVLAGLGRPAIPAAIEPQIRGAALCPGASWSVNLTVNAEGIFRWGDETLDEGRAAHRPLKVRNPAFGGELAGVEALMGFAHHDAFRQTPFGLATAHAAIGWCRARLNQQPGEFGAMVCPGTLLDGVEQPDEAERWFRHATRTAPRDWRTWHALANHHQWLAWRAMNADLGNNPRAWLDAASDAQRLSARLRERTAGNREFERRMREAGDCHDWAVLFAPNAVEAYLARSAWHQSAAVLRMFASQPPGADPATWRAHAEQMAADARMVAELTDHPLAYGLVLTSGFLTWLPEDPTAAGPDCKRFWERAVARLTAMSRDPDPLTRRDARRVSLLIHVLALRDARTAWDVLNEMSPDPTDRSVASLAAMAYSMQTDGDVKPELLHDWVPPVSADNCFLLSSARERAGKLGWAAEAVTTGLRKFPADVRLNLMRTGLLLQHGTAADLTEVHVRLRRLEGEFAARIRRGAADWTDKDQEFLQIARLHRAVYLGLTGRTSAAVQVAWEAQQLGQEGAKAATQLMIALAPVSAPERPTDFALPVLQRADYLPTPKSALPTPSPAPGLPVLERSDFASQPIPRQ